MRRNQNHRRDSPAIRCGQIRTRETNDCMGAWSEDDSV